MKSRASAMVFAALAFMAIIPDCAQAKDLAGLPQVFDTYIPGPCSPNGQSNGGCTPGTLVRIRVVTVAAGLLHPWHIAFLPGGNMLVTELAGRLRIIRDGKLDAQPISGWPVEAMQARNLFSILVHPKFSENHFVYLSYRKARGPQGEANDRAPVETTLALARGRLDGTTLSEVHDIFVADA